MHLQLWVKLLKPCLNLLLPFLQILNLLKQDIIKILNLASFPRLPNLEQLVISHGEGCELCSKLLGARLELVVEFVELLLLLVDFFECDVHFKYIE